MSSYVDERWEKALQMIHEEVTEYQYETWFEHLEPSYIDDSHMVFEFENRFMMQAMRLTYSLILKNAVMISYGRELQIEFIGKGEKPSFQANSESSDAREAVSSFPQDAQMMFNPKYTFDTFVVGASNRFAHAAALSVAEQPARAYNPLFLYGGVGLGKTHLMHAIGHHILRVNPKASLLYITSEQFTNELILAIQKQTSQELRDRLRRVDVLMVDDIQFIAGKTATQEEFFHTFNALHSSGKQIVISSDRPPKEIPTLEERLKSRFEWGLIADIQKPDYETRIAILRKKAQLEHIDIDDSVLHFIARRSESNIRELEGSLTRVNAMAQLTGEPITLEIAQQAIDTIMNAEEEKIVTPESILKSVAEYFGVSEGDILSSKRNREIATARQVAMYLTRSGTTLSTTRIGDFFGGRDHTTVMHACEKIEEQLLTDESLRQALDKLKA